MESNEPSVDEALLRDFFRAELGTDLPPLLPGAAAAPKRRRLAWPVAVAAAVALLVVWVVWTTDGGGEPPELRELTVTESSAPVERITYPTAGGAVVQETTIKWTTIAFSEPESGDGIRWFIPEVSIVVQPAGPPPRKES